MKYDLVCFDLDGTLVNTFPFIIDSYKKAVIKKYGVFKESIKDITAQIGMPIKYFYANYPKEDRKELQDTFADINDKAQSTGVPFFDGIKEMLFSLKKVVKVGLVTSKRNQPLYEWIKKEGLLNFFDVVIGRNDTNIHKPNGEPLMLAMSKLNVSPNKTLYVGDAIFDILCAKNAKASSCLVGWTALTKQEIQEIAPDFIIDKPADILNLIKWRKNHLYI